MLRSHAKFLKSNLCNKRPLTSKLYIGVLSYWVWTAYSMCFIINQGPNLYVDCFLDHRRGWGNRENMGWSDDRSKKRQIVQCNAITTATLRHSFLGWQTDHRTRTFWSVDRTWAPTFIFMKVEFVNFNFSQRRDCRDEWERSICHLYYQPYHPTPPSTVSWVRDWHFDCHDCLLPLFLTLQKNSKTLTCTCLRLRSSSFFRNQSFLFANVGLRSHWILYLNTRKTYE